MTLLVTAIRQVRTPLYTVTRRGLASSSALRRAPLLVSPKDYQGLNNVCPLLRIHSLQIVEVGSLTPARPSRRIMAHAQLAP